MPNPIEAINRHPIVGLVLGVVLMAPGELIERIHDDSVGVVAMAVGAGVVGLTSGVRAVKASRPLLGAALALGFWSTGALWIIEPQPWRVEPLIVGLASCALLVLAIVRFDLLSDEP